MHQKWTLWSTIMYYVFETRNPIGHSALASFVTRNPEGERNLFPVEGKPDSWSLIRYFDTDFSTTNSRSELALSFNRYQQYSKRIFDSQISIPVNEIKWFPFVRTPSPVAKFPIPMLDFHATTLHAVPFRSIFFFSQRGRERIARRGPGGDSGTGQDTRVIKGRGGETIHQREPPRGCYHCHRCRLPLADTRPWRYANFGSVRARQRPMEQASSRKFDDTLQPRSLFFPFFVCNSRGGCNGGSQMQMQMTRPMRTADNCFLRCRQFLCSARVRTSWKISGRRRKDLGESWAQLGSFWCPEFCPARLNRDRVTPEIPDCDVMWFLDIFSFFRSFIAIIGLNFRTSILRVLDMFMQWYVSLKVDNILGEIHIDDLWSTLTTWHKNRP